MKTIKLMMLMLALSGCGTKIYPIDSTLIDEDTATVIVFNSGGCCNTEFPIFLDGENVGAVTQRKPLKFAVTPGFHGINIKEGLYAGDTRFNAKLGEVYYMKLWLDPTPYSPISMRIDQTYAVDSYEAGE